MAMLLKTIANMFTVGNTEEETEQKDGHISSMLLVTSFTGILFEFYREYINPVSWYGGDGYPFVLRIAYVLLSVSLVLWAVLCVLAQYRTSKCLSTPRNDPVSSVVQIFYGVIGVGTMIVHLVNIIIDIICYRENQLLLPVSKIPNNYFYIISAVGRSLQIMFICVQFISISRLSRFQLKRSLLVNYFLSVILLTNIAVYLFNTFRLVYGIIQHKNYDNFTSLSNKSGRKCYWSNPISTKFLQPMNGILFPLQQEYLQLSICFIASMFPKIGNFYHENRGYAGTTNDEFCQSPAGKTERKLGLLRPRCKNILISASSVAMFIPVISIVVIRQTTSYDGSLFTFYQWFVTLPTTVAIVVILTGFHLLRKVEMTHNVTENYEGYLMDNDTIYILSSVGSMIYNGIGFVYSITVSHSKMNSMRSILLMIEIYYQTIFIISLKTVSIKRVIVRLQYVFLFLLFPNGLSWIYDEFFSLLPNFDEEYETMIGNSWPAVKQTILPLSSFYRFQSFVFLYRFWKLASVR